MLRLATNKGFTLLEMILTVTIMAILVSLSMPAIFEYMRQRDIQNEDIALVEIRKALEAYLAQNGTLPNDQPTGSEKKWYELLAGYTSLTEEEIANDVFGRPRQYVRYENTERSMFGNPVSVFYATVLSMGVDGEAQDTYINASNKSTTIDGIGVSNKKFLAASNTKWWARKTTADAVVTAFSALRPGGNDHMMRFTNYSEVLDRYNLTMQRLDTLTQALETYARSEYANRVSFCSVKANEGHANCVPGLPEHTIYYPRSVPKDTTVKDTATYDDTTTIVNNTQSDTNRRTGMEKLMDILGLPRENCCSALKMSTTDQKPMPFYYFSNPRARSGTGCSTVRPGKDDNKLPARVTTESTPTTCG